MSGSLISVRRHRFWHRLGPLPLFAAVLLVAATPAPTANLSPPQRAVLDRYLGALAHGRFADAFALLSSDERRYFATPANFASIFAADAFRLGAYRVVAVRPAPPRGVVAIVSEDIGFFDPARQSAATATARVAYGIVKDGATLRIKDPYHPWRAFVPKDATTTEGGLKVTVRKLSFFTGRVEAIITFANLGDKPVTVLPYGRSLLRDDAGGVHHPIVVKLSALSDRNLRLGLRLPASAQYTGLMTFATPDRFAPKTLTLTLAPALRDDADAPFDVTLPAVAVPG